MKRKRFLRLVALLAALLLACTAAVADGVEPPPGGKPPEAADEGMPPELPGEGVEPPKDMKPAQAPGGQPGGTIIQGTSATTLEVDATISGGSFTSQKADENALRVTHEAQVMLTGVTIEKAEGDTSSTENSDFYGQNAGFLATDGAEAAISAVSVTTAATGSNAVVSYGDMLPLK